MYTLILNLKKYTSSHHAEIQPVLNINYILRIFLYNSSITINHSCFIIVHDIIIVNSNNRVEGHRVAAVAVHCPAVSSGPVASDVASRDIERRTAADHPEAPTVAFGSNRSSVADAVCVDKGRVDAGTNADGTAADGRARLAV